MQSLHRVEKSPPSDGTGGITVGDLSAQSFHRVPVPYHPWRHAAPLEMTVAAGAIGHTCGVKVQRVQKVQTGRFLGLTGPMGRRVLKFDGAFGPRVADCPYGAQRTHFALCELDL